MQGTVLVYFKVAYCFYAGAL